MAKLIDNQGTSKGNVEQKAPKETYKALPGSEDRPPGWRGAYQTGAGEKNIAKNK